MMQTVRLDEVRFEVWAVALSVLLLFLYSVDYRANQGVIANTRGLEPYLFFMGGVLIWLVLCAACIGFAVAWGWLDFTQQVAEMRWFYVGTLGVVWLGTVGMVGGVLSVWMVPLLFGMRGLPLYAASAAGLSVGVYQVLYPAETVRVYRVRVLTLATLVLCAACVGNIAVQYTGLTG
ncbi:MAG: hypothetical protein AAF787_11285 [Chloroflexota bacterium]